MSALPFTSTYFTITINLIADGPFSLYSILSTGLAPTGCTLGTGASIPAFTGKPVASVSFQNVSGGNVYIGDNTLTGSTNMGFLLPPFGVLQINNYGGNAWMNALYFNASANTTVINISVIYA